MWRHFRRLGDDGAIDIDDRIAGFAHLFCRLAQEQPAIRTLVAGIGIGKMPANITQTRCTEQGIGDGVQQHIGVRVPV